MRVALLFNPVSGSYRADRIECLRVSFAGKGHHVTLSDSRDLLSNPAIAACDLICVVGGDGTLRDVITAWHDIGSDPRFVVYPAGTINLIAREAGYSADFDQFVTRAVAGCQVAGNVAADTNTRLHHFARVNQSALLACASVGPDSVAVQSVSASLKRRIGRLAYVAALAKLLRHWPRQRLHIKANQRSYDCEAVIVMNGRYFAGPWSVCPGATLTDPHLQLLLLPTARRRDFARLILSTSIARVFADKNWIRLVSTDIAISGDGAHPVQVDGDITATLPVQIRVDNAALRFA